MKNLQDILNESIVNESGKPKVSTLGNEDLGWHIGISNYDTQYTYAHIVLSNGIVGIDCVNERDFLKNYSSLYTDKEIAAVAALEVGETTETGKKMFVRLK